MLQRLVAERLELPEDTVSDRLTELNVRHPAPRMICLSTPVCRPARRSHEEPRLKGKADQARIMLCIVSWLSCVNLDNHALLLQSSFLALQLYSFGMCCSKLTPASLVDSDADA